MKFLAALILLSFASAENLLVDLDFNKAAAEIGEDCNAVASATDAKSPEWKSEFLYSVEVCAVFKGKLELCDGASADDSTLTLSLVVDGGEVGQLQGKFALEKQEMDAARNVYCSTFNACDILDKLTSTTDISKVKIAGKVLTSKASGTGTVEVIVRGTGIGVSSKTDEEEFDVSLNPYSISRVGTFCDEYACLNEFTPSEPGKQFTSIDRKMMLPKGATIPTCKLDDVVEGTKIFMTTYEPIEGFCDAGGEGKECAGKIVIQDIDEEEINSSTGKGDESGTTRDESGTTRDESGTTGGTSHLTAAVLGLTVVGTAFSV